MVYQTDDLQLGEEKYTLVASSDMVEEGDMVDIFFGKEILVLARVNGTVHAVNGICSHAYAELVDGELDEHCLYCPLHFAGFDIRDGSVVEGPADQPISVYQVVEQDGSIWIKE